MGDVCTFKTLCERADRISSVQFSRSVVSDSLQPHESQHARPPCPSPTPRVHSDSCPSSQWCHPAILSPVVPFSSCPQSLPASKSFPVSQLFAWGGQSTGVSASASFPPKKSQGWSPSEWTGWGYYTEKRESDSGSEGGYEDSGDRCIVILSFIVVRKWVKNCETQDSMGGEVHEAVPGLSMTPSWYNVYTKSLMCFKNKKNYQPDPSESMCVCMLSCYSHVWLLGARLLCPWDFRGKNTGVSPYAAVFWKINTNSCESLESQFQQSF